MKRPHRFRLAAAAATLLLLVTVMSVAMFHQGPSTARAASNARSIGVFINGFPSQGSTLLSQYQQQVGVQPQVAMWFQRMDQPFSASDMNTFSNLGIVPMVSMDIPDGVSNDQFIAGTDNSLLQAYAQAAAAWGKPFFFRFNHEYNGNWYSFSLGSHTRSDGTTYTNTAQNFIAAWHHAHDIFAQAGATNAKFVFNPNNVCSGACVDFAPSYPGDAYVDWVGLDSYNFGTYHTSGWQTFTHCFSSYSELVSLAPSKPMMVAETASVEQGGDKAAWITSAFTQEIPQTMPAISLVVWFDMNKSPEDWRVNSSTTSLAAWQAVVSSSAWQGSVFGTPTPTPTATPTNTPKVTPTSTPTATPTPTGGSTYFNSFEDGGVDGWLTKDSSSQIQNSTTYAQDGTHSLQVSYQNTDSGTVHYHHVAMNNQTLGIQPGSGQTVSVYVYVPVGTVSAHIYIEDANHQWHSDPIIVLRAGQWTRLTYTIPSGTAVPLYHVGVQFAVTAATGTSGTIYIDSIGWS